MVGVGTGSARASLVTDGELHGGGGVGRPDVVRLSLLALADGEPRRERNRKQVRGAVEVVIEPHRPELVLAVVGDAPATHAGFVHWQTMSSSRARPAGLLWISSLRLWITTQTTSVFAPMNVPRRRSIVGDVMSRRGRYCP